MYIIFIYLLIYIAYITKKWICICNCIFPIRPDLQNHVDFVPLPYHMLYLYILYPLLSIAISNTALCVNLSQFWSRARRVQYPASTYSTFDSSSSISLHVCNLVPPLVLFYSTKPICSIKLLQKVYYENLLIRYLIHTSSNH